MSVYINYNQPGCSTKVKSGMALIARSLYFLKKYLLLDEEPEKELAGSST